MQTAAFRAAGLPHTYTPVDVSDASALAHAVRLIRGGLYQGANVTAPHKRAVLPLVDAIDPSAAEVEAANVIAVDAAGRLVAHNTDVAALEGEIAAATTVRSRAAILGAGGGAAAAVAACKRLGFAIVGVTTRTWRDTVSMLESPGAQRIREQGALTAIWPSHDVASTTTKLSMAMRLQWTELAEKADIVVQATSAGMLGGPAGDEVAALVPFERMPRGAVALDLVYRPPVTPFLRRASEAGLVAISGLGMLVRQAEASYRIWLGSEPPPGVMRKAAEVVVARERTG
jgi:shikimate dehydrogenase